MATSSTQVAEQEAPTTDLRRTATFEVVRAGDSGDGLTLSGYGAVFNAPTLIDSWEGRFEERLAHGAFKRSIDRKGPKGVRLQFDHGSHPVIGSIPIGTIEELREDKRGLFVEARMHDNWLVQPVRDAIREGSISGMSFRFRVIRDEWDETDPDLPVRTIKEVELVEVGPVVWPAYEQTSVGVRAREIAQALMDPSQRAAVARALMVGTSNVEDAGTSDSLDGVRDDPPAAEGEPPVDDALPDPLPDESRDEPAEHDPDPDESRDTDDDLDPAPEGQDDGECRDDDVASDPSEYVVSAPKQAQRPTISRERLRLTLASHRERMAGVVPLD